MNEMGSLKTAADSFEVVWNASGGLEELRRKDEKFVPATSCTHFELNGEPAEASLLDDGKGFRLETAGTAGKLSATLSLSSDREIRLHLDREGVSEVERAGMVLSFPEEAEFHLAEYRNTGRLLDRSMPIGESYETKLIFNFLVVRYKGMWIRFRADHNRLGSAEIQLFRHPSLFTLTFSWDPAEDAAMAVFASLEEAMADYRNLMEERFGIRKVRDQGKLPQWIRNVKLILTVDMLRSNWEISHDYEDLRKLSKELRKAGCPEDTLIYIPGWHGAYDSTHPTYRPHLKLGGEEGFRKMLQQVHDDGFHVMIHTTGWGIDPYHPDIDDLVKLVERDEDGDLRGWQIGMKGNPPKCSLKYFTPGISLGAGGTASEFQIDTPPIPARCEALIAVGGLSGASGRVSLGADLRSITTPEGWFRSHDEFAFAFPLLLMPGPNTLKVQYQGEGTPDWGKAWYRIRFCFVPRSPYSSWTWPILRADTSNSEYIRIYVESVKRAVQDFGIDAVHVDATTFTYPRDNRKLLRALHEALPGVPINSEGYHTFEELGFWTFTQNACQSLLGGKAGPREQGSLAVSEGLEEMHAWLDKPSPVCRFSRDYTRMYPHLCAANGFVPIGKVCNTFPKRQIPRRKEELWKVLRNANRLGYVPGLRVNYRDYGLDKDTVKAIREIGSQE
jgi:hypothetical protein